MPRLSLSLSLLDVASQYVLDLVGVSIFSDNRATCLRCKRSDLLLVEHSRVLEEVVFVQQLNVPHRVLLHGTTRQICRRVGVTGSLSW